MFIARRAPGNVAPAERNVLVMNPPDVDVAPAGATMVLRVGSVNMSLLRSIDR